MHATHESPRGEPNEERDEAVILCVVDTSFNLHSNDGLLIHPGRTIAKLVRKVQARNL